MNPDGLHSVVTKFAAGEPPVPQDLRSFERFLRKRFEDSTDDYLSEASLSFLKSATPLHSDSEITASANLKSMIQLILYTCLEIAVFSRNAVEIIAQVSEDSKEVARRSMFRTFVRSQQESLNDANLSEVLEGFDVESFERKDIFWAAIASLPATPVEGEDEEWPFLNKDSASGLSPDFLPEILWPMLHEKCKAAFLLLPPIPQALLLQFCQFLGFPKQLGAWEMYGEEVMPEAVWTSAVRLALQKRPTPAEQRDGGEANLRRHLSRAAYVLTFLFSTWTALHQAMQVVTNRFNLAEDLNRNTFAHTFDLPSGLSTLVNTTMDKHFEQRDLPTGQWVTIPLGSTFSSLNVVQAPVDPGTQLPPPSVDSALGAKDSLAALTALLRLPNSQYRMPGVEDGQRQWEDWFGRVSALRSTFPNLSPHMVVMQLMGNVPTDDRRVFGWSERAAQNPLYTVDDFLAHIRKQVLPSGTTRREGARQLEQLKSEVRSGAPHMENCVALGTKIRQLMQQTFPANSSDERDPFSLLDGARHVHKCLEALSQGSRKLKIVRAWKGYTLFDATTMFMTYLDSSLHSSAEESKKLIDSYIDAVFEHLSKAHHVYLQIADLEEVAEPKHKAASLKNLKSRSDASSAGTPKSGSAEGRTPSSSCAKRPAFQPAKSFGGKKQRSDGGNTGPASRPPPQTQEAPKDREQFITRGMRAVRAAGLEPGSLRSMLGLPALSADEAATAVASGACLLCQQPGHGYKICPLFKKGAAVRNDIQKFKDNYFPEYNKRNKGPPHDSAK